MLVRVIALLTLNLLFVGVHADTLKLAAAPFETYITGDGEPARVNRVINAAFEKMGEPVELQIMREAFLGSSVRAGRVAGEFAFIDLGEKQQNLLLSAPYLPLYLYATSKKGSVKNIKLIPHLKDMRIAIENKFANTPTFRLLKDVKWSRNPSAYDAYKQLADDRAPLLITSRLLIEEFNLLLDSVNQELLHYSAAPLVTTGFQLALNANTPNAKAIIDKFNNTISTMQKDGSYNELLGIHWLMKDVNQDGVADYIGNSRITKQSAPLTGAFPLDSTLPGDESVFVIDNQTYNNFAAAQARLHDTPARESLLDPEVYDTMLKRW